MQPDQHTTDSEGRADADLAEAGAPEVQITPDMIEAGGQIIYESIFFRGSVSSAEYMASEVYRTMASEKARGAAKK